MKNRKLQYKTLNEWLDSKTYDRSYTPEKARALVREANKFGALTAATLRYRSVAVETKGKEKK